MTSRLQPDSYELGRAYRLISDKKSCIATYTGFVELKDLVQHKGYTSWYSRNGRVSKNGKLFLYCTITGLCFREIC